MSIRIRLLNKISSFQIIILGFAGVILIGTLLLMLPIASNSGVVTPMDKALFTSTSAVCVTGLVVFDTASYWSFFGQVIILIMIQIGGLGVITVASSVSILIGRKFSIMHRQTLQNALSAPQVGGIIRLTKFILLGTFLIEVLGAIMMLPVFVPQYGLEGIWMSVFHSISAFCNAGFDLMGTHTGQFSSLTGMVENGYLVSIIALLIVVGGIGFFTWKDITTKGLKIKEYRMQTKVILTTTLVLILVPFCIFFFGDFASMPIGERLSNSFFQAVTPRTAGFNTADLNKMTDAGRSITMILMLIGGSPGSTAGGIKTTTLAILFANTLAVFRKRKNANFFGRRIDDSVIKNASTIIFMYVTLAIGAAIIISLVEGIPMQTCMFETFSAIGTVGLTLGVTPGLTIISRLILVLLMFFGRVGGLTIIFAAFSRRNTVISKYPMDNIMVG